MTTNYTLDLAAGLTQVLEDGTNTYLYGNGRIAQASSTTEYFLGDALGSVRQLVDPAGAVMLTQSYSPYGETVSSVGSGHSPYQYTGESSDANGLTYLRVRYYAPQDGRFISRDTWDGVYSSPQSLNRWNYTEANPVNYIDPSGHWCVAGFSFGPGRDCTEEETLRWFDFYQNQATLYSRFRSSKDDRADMVAGFVYEYLDTVAVLPIMSISFSTMDSLSGCGWNSSRYAQGSMYPIVMQTNQMFTAGRYAARAFLTAQALAEIGVGVAGIGGGIGISAITGGAGTIAGVPIATISAALTGHGTLVLATVGARTAIDPLRPLNFAAFGRGGGRPTNRQNQPYPRQKVEGYGEVPFPDGDIHVTDPNPMRANYTQSLRKEFRDWWYKKYGWYPSPSEYEIHHIQPLSRGGNNDFSNMVPLKIGTQHQQFTTWWLTYP